MTLNRFPQSFTQDVTMELSRFPREGLLALGAVGLLSAASNLFYWTHGPNFQTVDYLLSAALVLAWNAIVFFCVARMVQSPITWKGALRFYGTTAALLLPAALALGAVLLAAKAKSQSAIVLGTTLALISCVPIILLPGWPAWQMVSARFIGPMKALRATSEFRWSLLIAAMVVGYLDRALPETSSAEDILTASGLAFGNSAIACLSIIVGVAIAIAAYRRMSESGS